MLDAAPIAAIAGKSEARHVESLRSLTCFRLGAIEFVKGLLEFGYTPGNSNAKEWIMAIGPLMLVVGVEFEVLLKFHTMCEKEKSPEMNAQDVVFKRRKN